MKATGAVSLVVSSIFFAGVIVVEMADAQPPQAFAVETRTFADVSRLLAGTWTLKQRLNPDGTPYRSRIQGVTYVSLSTKSRDALGPHALATIYSKESGVADTGFFNYPPEIAGKAFQMESSGTWLIHNIRNTAEGAEISMRTYSLSKGNIPPFTNGVVMNADVRYNLSRPSVQAPATKGAKAITRVVPRLNVARIIPGEMQDLTGNRINPQSFMDACCGMTSLSIDPGEMRIGWNNKGSDVWVKTSASVPAQFR
jgi:hypothetical protein